MNRRKVKRVFACPSEALGLDASIRAALSKSIAACKDKSRAQIAEALSAETGTPISVRKLNEFTACSRRERRFPAAWVIPFCRITGRDTLQRILLGPELERLLALGECVREKLVQSDFVPRLHPGDGLKSSRKVKDSLSTTTMPLLFEGKRNHD